ncbi:MAG: chorismate synthase, partial [Nitriliruptoraceae bacterium]
RIPRDLAATRADDPQLALTWIHAVRATLGEGLDAGARVTGLTRDGWYVLAERGGIRELSPPR